MDTETTRQIDCFMMELSEIVDNHSDEDLKGMNFKPLYDKYPRVRIGLRRALYAIRRDLEENKCHVSN